MTTNIWTSVTVSFSINFIFFCLIIEKQSLEMTSEIPAFLCERVNLECDVRRMADMAVVNDLSRQRRNMLYVSRGQLKKHSNTALNVSVSAHHISQQVY